MKNKKHGQTIIFASPPAIAGYASVAGKREGEGPLGQEYDLVSDDTTFGAASWEKAESCMQKQALSKSIQKASLSASDIDMIFAGDLLNQCIGSTYGLRDFDLPFVGLYGACSTMAEGLAIASMAIDGGFASRAAALTSSHFCSAERQYRLPLEYGGQRSPTAQWTVTGSGAIVLSAQGSGPFVKYATIGKICDMGITDSGNMGAAMAPVNTI